MAELNENLEKVVLTKLMYLNAVIVGIITGLILGGGTFLVTIFLILKGGEVVGPHLELLGQYFIGYKVTFTGSLIGLAYGLVIGFIIGYAVSSLYNWLANLRLKRHK